MHKSAAAVLLLIWFAEPGYAQQDLRSFFIPRSKALIPPKEDKQQTPPFFGVACNNDFYVTAIGVAGAVLGTVISRGWGELARVIVSAGSDKLAEKNAPRLCEAVVGWLSPSQKIETCPTGQFFSLAERKCVELVVTRQCTSGQEYNSVLGTCVTEFDISRFCGDNEYYSDSQKKCLKLSGTPHCPLNHVYSFQQGKCLPFESADVDCGMPGLEGVCIPLR
jgi:hypothetical protein